MKFDDNKPGGGPTHSDGKTLVVTLASNGKTEVDKGDAVGTTNRKVVPSYHKATVGCYGYLYEEASDLFLYMKGHYYGSHSSGKRHDFFVQPPPPPPPQPHVPVVPTNWPS